MLTLDSARAWYPTSDPVHGFDHVMRVYRMAERIALAENADVEIVRAAALLHDVDASDAHTREKRANHHQASADFAHRVLEAEGWLPERIEAVLHCIRAHRFRHRIEPPQSLEAQILFDADKLDAIGATGVVRAIAYAALDNRPAYFLPSQRFLNTGQTETDEPHSAYHEYLFKLSKIKERLYTPTARALSEDRHRFLTDFFTRLIAETCGEDSAC